MRKIIAACALFGALAGFVLVLSSVGRAQTPPTGWQYAYLYHVDGSAPAIVYAEPDAGPDAGAPTRILAPMFRTAQDAADLPEDTLR
jgi:hypothetical protein